MKNRACAVKRSCENHFTSQFHLIFDREGNDHYDHHGEREIVINTANSLPHWSLVCDLVTSNKVTSPFTSD